MMTENQSDSPESGTGGPLYGVLAEFDTPGELTAAAEKVRDAGYTKWDCHSPFPVHGLDPAMGIRPTILPLLVFGGGIAGLGGALLLQWWTNAHDWPWLVSGKPFFSIPANIPIMFEGTILIAALTAFFAQWALNKLPQVWHPLFRSDRFLKATDNGFFIAIEATDPQFERMKTEALLTDSGATAVESVHYDPDPETRRMPKQIAAFIVVTAVLGLVPFAFVAKARATKSDQPHLHVFPDMDFQPKAKAQQKSDLFPDDRASRAPIDGTVARGELKADDHFFRGIDDGAWATTFPEQFEVTPEAMDRGQNRFEIYCTPCHGVSGHGDGTVASRADDIGSPKWIAPSNLHEEYIVKQPHGQIFNTISNGIRTMPAYKAQIPEEDRWAIVLYLRALQRSQKANISDVPPPQRSKIR